MRIRCVVGLLCALLAGCSDSGSPGSGGVGGAAGTGGVGGSGGSGGAVVPVTRAELTFLGVTQWLLRYGETTVLLDAYFSRPEDRVGGSTDEGLDLLQRVLDAAGVESVDFILVGHSHFDHAIDSGAAAMMTGAQVVGSQTTCFIAQSAGLPEDRCTVVGTGDELQLGEARMRAVRTIHTLPDLIGRFLEFDEVPTPEDSWAAPAGGPISYLVSFPGDEPFSMFYTNSISPIDGEDGSGEDYRAILNSAFSDVDGTTAWLGPVGFLADETDLIDYFTPIEPSFVVPHHFDGLTPDIEAGLEEPFAPSPVLTRVLADEGATLVAPEQYFEVLILTPEGITRSPAPLTPSPFGL